MRAQFREKLIAYGLTLVVLIVLEVLTTTLLPIMGIQSYKFPFNILIILFFTFKMRTPFLALMILGIEYFYSFFSVEGWAIGTFAGIMISFVVVWLKDLIHFSTAIMTILVTELFQAIWFLIISAFIYIQTSEFDYVLRKLARFPVESIVISFLAPVLFLLLDKIWKTSSDSMGIHSGEI